MRKSSLIMIGFLVISLTACSFGKGGSKEASNQAVYGQKGVQANVEAIARYVDAKDEVTRDEMVAKTNVDPLVPHGPSGVRYSVVSEKDKPAIAQMDYVMNQLPFIVRVCPTELESVVNDIGELYEEADISGLSYEWDDAFITTVGNYEAAGFINKAEKTGFLAWVDASAGTLYNVSMPAGADEDKLLEYAQACFSYGLE